MFMLDTNICIYVLKHHDPRLRARFKAARDLVISSITHAELCYGIENGVEHLKRERHRQLHIFLRRLHIESWGEAEGMHYGQIRAHLKREGSMIGGNDLLIAAHARCIQAVLVTNNKNEFSRVPGLKIDNWLAA